MTEIDRKEFFEAAKQPDGLGDEMHFHLVDANGTGYSVEGFETVGYQMHDFVMARTLAFHRRHGRWPKGVRAEMRLVWDDDRDARTVASESDAPWWQMDDQGATPISVDGRHRTAFLERRRSENRG